MTDTQPSIIGRDAVIVEAVTTHLHAAAKTEYRYTDPTSTRRGQTFTVLTGGPDDAHPGHVVKVTVELLHVLDQDSAAWVAAEDVRT